MLFITPSTTTANMTTPSKLTLSIHGYCINTGKRGPKPSHNPIHSEFDPNSKTQKRKKNRSSHPTPNSPGSNKATLKAKRAERRRLRKESSQK